MEMGRQEPEQEPVINNGRVRARGGEKKKRMSSAGRLMKALEHIWERRYVDSG